MSSASSAAGTATPESILSNIRNLDRKQLASIGVVFAEVLGFFTVGTMIGRMKIVGYHGGVHHEH
jgi:F-type H+-transporting ATPase subunit g